MKIRLDYVSNSSSSSFMLCGAVMKYDDLIKIVKPYMEKYNNEHGEDDQFDLEEDDFDCYDIESALTYSKKGLDNLEVVVETNGWGEYYDTMIGVSLKNMKEDQTLKEFKTTVLDGLNMLGFNLKYEDIKLESGGSDAGGSTFIDACG